MIYSEIDFQKCKIISVGGMLAWRTQIGLHLAAQFNSAAGNDIVLFNCNLLASGGMSGQSSPVHFVHSPSSTCVLLILLCNIRKTLVKHSPFINCYFFYSLYDTDCKNTHIYKHLLKVEYIRLFKWGCFLFLT